MTQSRPRLKSTLVGFRNVARRAFAGTMRAGHIANIDRVTHGLIEGWVKAAGHDDPVLIDVVVDDVVIARGLRADGYRRDVEDAGHGRGRFGFSCPTPDGQTVVGARIGIRLSSTQRTILTQVVTPTLAGVSQVTPTNQKPTNAPVCKGKIDELTTQGLRGWAVDTGRPSRILTIDVLVDGVQLARLNTDLARGDLLSRGLSEGRGGFHIDLPLTLLEQGPHRVEVVLPDGQVLSKTVEIGPAGQRAALNGGVAKIRPADVSVIVPVYNAADDVETCIQRLADHTPPGTEILMIDDASTDPRIGALLAGAAQLPGFHVLRNDSNQGFTRTINRGLDETGDRHVILLNSDARVTPGWVEGMLRAASSRPRVATVTAMSDRAGAFSAPKLGNENSLPPGVDEIAYARAFRRRSLGLYPAVPTGNGFCMFINRDALRGLGPLDAEAFPRGYGEENDFCMRAGRAGWWNLIDDRTYVFHDRSKSFGEQKTELLGAGRAVVDARYPEYGTAIGVFSSLPSIAMARFRAAQAMADLNRPGAGLPAILYVVATQTGGTPQTNMDLMREIADEMAPWLLHCDRKQMTLSRLEGGELIRVLQHRLAEQVDPVTHRSGEYDAVMCEWLDLVDPQIVHIRHLAWHGLSLPALARARGSKVVFSFHDFYALCPTVKLLDDTNTYCGGTCTATAGECSPELWPDGSLPALKNKWVHVWRDRFANVLRDCDAYVTTSESARARLQEQLGLDASRFFVIPHGRSFSRLEQLRQRPRHGEPIRILLPGNIDTPKGRDVLIALLEHDRAGLFEFHVLGNIAQPHELARYKRLVLHGPYKRDDFNARVAAIGPHLGAVFSIWDETYCHTLTELWSAGVPALVFDFPTVAGRVRASGAGWVLPHDDIAALYDRIVAIALDQDEQARVDAALLQWQAGRGVGATTGMMAGAYRDVYRHALGRPGRRPVIAVVGPSSADQRSANASTQIRLWERTVNAPDRACVYVRMTPAALIANVREGAVDGAILQRNVIPPTLVQPLVAEMEQAGLRYIFDMDDDLFDVPADKDPAGYYAAYLPSLQTIVSSAAVVTVSTPPLAKALARRNPRITVLPNRLSERLWRGILSDKARDGVVRALYMGTPTHQEDFDLIAPALAAVTQADSGFRVSVIGIQSADLPAWAERIDIPDACKSYDQFVPWLKSLAGGFDLGLAPLVDNPFNRFKSELKIMDYSALGLPVLASDMPVYRPFGTRPGVTLVQSTARAWQNAIADLVQAIRAHEVDRAAIRKAALASFGMAPTLGAFDDLVLSVVRHRAPESAKAVSRRAS